MSEIKIKRVFNLRKKIDATPAIGEEPLSNTNHRQSELLKKMTESDEPPVVQQPPTSSDRNNTATFQSLERLHCFSNPELIIETNYIHFEKQINRVQIKPVKVSNVGTCAVYYEWVRLPRNKINPHAVLDQNHKFFCHHEKNVIKPGESITFMFSFLSKISGIFIEQFELRCQPSPITPLSHLKLEGKAFIKDQFAEQRLHFKKKMNDAYIQKTIQEVVSDIIENVKSPAEPRPDTSKPEVAMRQFQKVNENFGIFYNPLAFGWWMQLFDEVYSELNLPQQDKYWNLSIWELHGMIQKVECEVKKECFEERYLNYYHLSRKPLLDKSCLYSDIKNLLGKVALHIAGEYNDTARKQLDMWESNWKEVQDDETEAGKKARDQQLAKIKAEWLKKAKKKKWTEDDEKAMINDYKTKIQTKAKEEILKHFDGYESASRYIRTEQLVHKQPLPRSYFRFLERLKTVKETDIEGRSVFMKVQLKLREGVTLEKMHEFKEYLVKKKEEQKRLEEQRRDLEKQKNDKKKTAKKQAKKKEEVEEKPLFFDIMQILDQRSYKSILEAIKYVTERSPKLLIIGCNYGPRTGHTNDDTYSLQFLVSQLKLSEIFVDFVRHSELQGIPEKIENESYNDGTVLLLENLNLLNFQTMRYEAQGKNHVLLMSEIQEGVAYLQKSVEVLVNDNYSELESGIALYLKRENVLGTDWWKNIGICLKAENSDMIIGGTLTPQKLMLIDAARWYANRIFLVGEIGIKFYMNKHGLAEFAGLKLTAHEKMGIAYLDSKIAQPWQKDVPNNKKTPEPHKAAIIIPNDVLIKHPDAHEQSIEIQAGQNHQDCHTTDVGASTVASLLEYIRTSKKVFMFQQPYVNNSSVFSITALFRQFAKVKEMRVARHQQENKKGSINYDLDTIITIVGDFEQSAQRVELKEKPVKQKRQLEEGEEQEEQEEEEVKEEDEEKVKNITLVQDFFLEDAAYPLKVLSGTFNASLSNIYKYPKSDD